MNMKKILLIALLAISVASVSAQKWYQYGFKVGTSFPVERQYSLDGDYLCGLRNADFGIFFRAGKYVYGEIGFGYVFYKCDFSIDILARTEEDAEVCVPQSAQIVSVQGILPFHRKTGADLETILIPLLGRDRSNACCQQGEK